MIIRIHFHHASLHELTICSSWEHSWWFVVFDGLYTYSTYTCVQFGTCILWICLKLIGSCIIWGSVRLMYHMQLIHQDFSLESQCPSACINYCFLVLSLWATEASFLRHKENIFVKWGVRLTDNEMYESYLVYSLLALVHTYMSSQPFYLLHMPSVCYE